MRVALYSCVLIAAAVFGVGFMTPDARAEVAPALPSQLAMPRPQSRPLHLVRQDGVPTFRWSHVPGSEAWTAAALDALATHGQILEQTTPADIGDWCPAYMNADADQRRLFWVGMLSTLSKHESTYRPTAVGGGGKWYGLVQILPATARFYGCEARSGAALKDGAANMRCAVRILAVTVPRDNVVSRGMRGIAADWGPFHQRRKREDMRSWMLEQPYCAVKTDLSQPRPKARDLTRFAEERPKPRPARPS